MPRTAATAFSRVAYIEGHTVAGQRAWYGGGDLKSRRPHPLAEADASGEGHWPLAGHLGTIRDVLDADGTLLNHVVHDSLGNVLSPTGVRCRRQPDQGPR